MLKSTVISLSFEWWSSSSSSSLESLQKLWLTSVPFICIILNAMRSTRTQYDLARSREFNCQFTEWNSLLNLRMCPTPHHPSPPMCYFFVGIINISISASSHFEFGVNIESVTFYSLNDEINWDEIDKNWM